MFEVFQSHNFKNWKNHFQSVFFLIFDENNNSEGLSIFLTDDYNNCTLDSLFALKIVMEVPEINPDYLLSTDDDIYLYLPHLWYLLYQRKMFQKVQQTQE